jgi:hypothetical protein
MIWLKITPPMLGVLSPYLNRAGRQHLKPHAARLRMCLCQAPDYRAPVRPALVLLEPNQGKSPAMDYALDRLLVTANRLIRDPQTTIMFPHLDFFLMSRWQARIGDLD